MVFKMEKQKTIGEILREGRRAKGLDFQQVSSKLCIAKSYLRALEADDNKNLPCQTYAIGFLRTYSEYLDLDADAMVRRAKVAPDSTQPMHEAIVAEPVHDSGMPNRSLVVAALLGVGSLIYGAGTFSDQRAVDENVPAPASHVASLMGVGSEMPSSPVVDDPVAFAAPDEPIADKTQMVPDTLDAISNGNSGAELDIATAEMAIVEIKAASDTWVMIVGENNQTIMNGIIRSGESFRINEDKALLLSTGNAGSLSVYIDGELIAPFGQRGVILDALHLDIGHLRAEARPE